MQSPNLLQWRRPSAAAAHPGSRDRDPQIQETEAEQVREVAAIEDGQPALWEMRD